MDNKRNSGIFFNIFAVVLSLASFFVAWKMILPQYVINKNHYAKVDAEVNAAKDKLESLKVAKTSLDNLGTIVDQMFIAIPSEKDDPNIIAELEAIATKNNAYIPSIQIADSGSAGSSAVAVSFSVSGGFADMQGFVNSLENDLKFFSVKSLAISGNKEGLINLSFQVEAYQQTDSSLTSTTQSSTLPSDVSGGIE